MRFSHVEGKSFQAFWNITMIYLLQTHDKHITAAEKHLHQDRISDLSNATTSHLLVIGNPLYIRYYYG